MTLLIIIALLAAAGALWLALVRHLYRLPDRPTLLPITTSDGWTLSLWRRAPGERRFVEPVVLCHGLGNNHQFFEFRGRSHLARVLAEAGFEVFSMDCRGAGRWRPAAPGFAQATIDDHVDRDVPAVLEAIERLTGERRVLWVGHSLGGVIGVLAAARAAKGRLAARVTIGSPLYFPEGATLVPPLKLAQALSPAERFPARVFTTAIAPGAGRFPPPRAARLTANIDNIEGLDQRFLLANAFADLWRGVLGQLETWIRTGELRSAETGVDLRGPALLEPVPTLVVGGSVDHLAPPAQTKRFFEALPHQEKALLLCGPESGAPVEYGHGDLVLGRDADRDVYPTIQAFLERHATRLERQSGKPSPTFSPG